MCSYAAVESCAYIAQDYVIVLRIALHLHCIAVTRSGRAKYVGARSCAVSRSRSVAQSRRRSPRRSSPRSFRPSSHRPSRLSSHLSPHCPSRRASRQSLRWSSRRPSCRSPRRSSRRSSCRSSRRPSCRSSHRASRPSPRRSSCRSSRRLSRRSFLQSDSGYRLGRLTGIRRLDGYGLRSLAALKPFRAHLRGIPPLRRFVMKQRLPLSPLSRVFICPPLLLLGPLHPLSFVSFRLSGVLFRLSGVLFRPACVSLRPLCDSLRPLCVSLSPLCVSLSPLCVSLSPLCVSLSPLCDSLRLLSSHKLSYHGLPSPAAETAPQSPLMSLPAGQSSLPALLGLVTTINKSHF